MPSLDRATIQGVLAIIIVIGVFLLIGFGPEGRIPLEALFGLAGAVVGYYFGFSVTRSGSPGDEHHDERKGQP